MEFTKEAWENAPEGARLELNKFGIETVRFVGYTSNDLPVVETGRGTIDVVNTKNLRIVLPKRKVTVQLWRGKSGILTVTTNEVEADVLRLEYWTLLDEHTFEIEGE